MSWIQPEHIHRDLPLSQRQPKGIQRGAWNAWWANKSNLVLYLIFCAICLLGVFFVGCRSPEHDAEALSSEPARAGNAGGTVTDIDGNVYRTVTIGTNVVEYDAAGNLYQGDRNYRYYYDFENRLARVDRKAMGQTGGGEFGPEGGPVIPYRTVALFDYDALGRRIRATYFDKYQQITDDTLYYYDGHRVLAEFDYDEATGDQTLLRFFVDGPLYVDEHLLMYDATTGLERQARESSSRLKKVLRILGGQ